MKKRISLDERGNPLIEIENADGAFERVGAATSVIRKLDGAVLELVDTAFQRRPDFEPYGMKVGSKPYEGATAGASKQLRKRSGLDYLRALSEEIKRQRPKHRTPSEG